MTVTPSSGSTTKPITREDLRAGFAGLQGEVTDQAEAAKNTVMLIGAGAVALVAVLAFLLGRRKGKQEKTYVEIRRGLEMLPMARRRAITDGVLGGNKRWLLLGGLAWALRAYQTASTREPEVVYRAELKPGETLVLARQEPKKPKRRRRS